MDGPMRTGLKILHAIFFLLLLGSGDFQVQGLTVTGKQAATEALRGEDVTIPCLVSGVPIPLNLQEVSVIWISRLLNGTERVIYHFHGSHHQPLRNGSHMSDSDIEQGNASLSIPNFQIEDEGEYRCSVIVTSDSDSFTSALRVSGYSQVQGMTVTGKDVPTEALRGEDVTIPCLVSGVPIPLNLQNITVVWRQRLQDESEYEVYRFQDSHHQSWRPGSHMNDSDLQQGNASLSIPNIQITDEGEYRCHVIVTPDAGIGTSTLHVSVKPRTALPRSVSINLSDKNSLAVSCDANMFYPEAIRIRWVKYSRSAGTNSSLDGDTCAGLPSRNSDGTFNVTSTVTVSPSGVGEDGDKYVCLVSHRTLDKNTAFSFTLRVSRTKIQRANMTPFIVGLVLGFLTTGLIFWMFLVAHPRGDLTISKISGDLRIPHKKRTTLTCQITSFIPKEIQINVYLKRRNEIKKHLIVSWESTDWKSSNNSSNGLATPGGRRENNSVLEEGADRRTLLSLEMKVEMTKSRDEVYKYLCSISITPDEDTDYGALLVVEVEHPSLKRPVSVNRILFVYKDEPSLSQISGGQFIPHLKRTTLTCQITNFRPKEIQINVYLRTPINIKKTLMASWKSTDRTSSNNSSNDLSTPGGQRDNNPDVLSVLEEGADRRTLLPVEIKAKITKSWFGMYKCRCFINLTLNADTDDKALLEVEVEHASLIRPASVSKILCVRKDIPCVSDIVGEMWIPQMKKTTLSFQITEFKRKEIHVKLYLKRRNEKEIHVLLSWASVGRPSGEDNAGHQRGDMIEKDPLMKDVVKNTMLPVEMEVEMTETEDGSYKCDCRISLTPNADRDDGAVLVVKVTHATLPLPRYRWQILNVIKGDTPSLWRRWRQDMRVYDRINILNSMS